VNHFDKGIVMITKDDVRKIRENLAALPTPVLSLYADVNPGKPFNHAKAWVARAKNSLKELDLPSALRRELATVLEQELSPEARTLALFAHVDQRGVQILRLPIHADLPIVDLRQGRIEARWGEPYITPIVYALDEYERTGIVWLRGAQWKFYEFFLGEIEERTKIFAEITPEIWKELEEFDPNRIRALAIAKNASLRDKFARRMETAAYRYSKRLAALVEKAVSEMEIRRLVLLGAADSMTMFFQMLAKSMRDIVVARITDVPARDATPFQVGAKVGPVLENLERQGELALLDQIRQQPGVWGLDPTLDALQLGRLDVLVAPWNLDARILRSPGGVVAATPEPLEVLCPGQPKEDVLLRDVLPELCEAYATRLEIVSGPAEEKLMKEFGGLAGRLRW
jgi:hypothetical protein